MCGRENNPHSYNHHDNDSEFSIYSGQNRHDCRKLIVQNFLKNNVGSNLAIG